MGIQAKTKARRRADIAYQANKANARGLRLGDSLAQWLRASSRGPSAIVEGLLARSNRRWENLANSAALLATAACHPLSRCVQIEHAIYQLRARGHDDEAERALRSVEHSIETIASYSRLAMTGAFVGAAVLARDLFELWTSQLAHATGATRGPNRDEYMRAAWAPYKANPTAAWNALSEAIHGRGLSLGASRWDSELLMQSSLAQPKGELTEGFTLVSTTAFLLELIVAHIWNVVRAVAKRRGVQLPQPLDSWCAPDSRLLAAWIPESLLPANYDVVFGEIGTNLRQHIDRYEQTLKSSTHWPPQDRGLLTASCFLAHRARVHQRAATAFQVEKATRGQAFSPEELRFRQYDSTVTTEMAGLICLWDKRPGASSLSVAANAYRSAYLLWLEDDIRAMTCARTTLEALARARTFRAKPKRAERTDARPGTTARDWLEESGLSRLGGVLETLSSLSHFDPVTYRDPRPILEQLSSLGPGHADASINTARGDVLRMLLVVMQVEVAQWLEGTPALATAYREATSPAGKNQQAEQQLENWLSRVLATRRAIARRDTSVNAASSAAPPRHRE